MVTVIFPKTSRGDRRRTNAEATTREGKGGAHWRRAEESNEHGVRSNLVHPKGGSWKQAWLELETVDGADAHFHLMHTHANSA